MTQNDKKIVSTKVTRYINEMNAIRGRRDRFIQSLRIIGWIAVKEAAQALIFSFILIPVFYMVGILKFQELAWGMVFAAGVLILVSFVSTTLCTFARKWSLLEFSAGGIFLGLLLVLITLAERILSWLF